MPSEVFVRLLVGPADVVGDGLAVSVTDGLTVGAVVAVGDGDGSGWLVVAAR